MSIKYYNQPPYFDDFDETKNYLRMLFRPGYAVQARELTQLQTALQNQIGKFGDHVFKDGSRVLDAEHTIDQKFDYVKVESTYITLDTTLNVDDYYDEFVGTTITGATTGVQAQVLAATPAEGTDPITLFVAYKNSGTDVITKTFAAGEVITSDGTTPRQTQVKPAAETPIGKGTRVSINPGVYYVNSSFVYVNTQEVIVSKYTTNPSARIVLEVVENIITSAEDPSLVDNALGAPNVSAPGAHRYNIDLVLKVEDYDLAARTLDKYITLAVLNQGVLQAETRGSDYSEILKVLAQRTYEESGNYTVRPFPIQVKDHVDGNPDKLSVALEPSVAYVDGFRIETISSTYIDLDRSRDPAKDIKSFANSSSFASYGNYVTVQNMSGIPDINNFTTMDLVNGTATVIGTARARFIEPLSTTQYRIYLFDIQMNAGQSRSDIVSLNQTSVTPNFSADLVVTAPSYVEDSGNNVAIFPLAYEGCKSVSNITIYTKKTWSTTISSDKAIFVTDSSDELFSDFNDIVVVDNAGNVLDNTGLTVTPGGTTELGQQITITGAQITALNGTVVKMASTTLKRGGKAERKSKTLVADHSVYVSSPNTAKGSYDDLQVADVLRIKGVYMSSSLAVQANPATDRDITSRYELDNGQRDNYYANARVRLKRDAAAPTGQICVVVDYFEHGIGDFFTVNSYDGQVTWDEIPEYSSSKGTYNLRNVIDCRPRLDQTGSSFTGLGGSLVEFVAVNTLTLLDLEIYLPRKDKLYVKSNGEFGIVRGVSDLKPSYPTDVENSMTLYLLDVAPYTGKVTDVRPTFVENKRYTMRDIGKIEDRVKKLEYYTTLSLLEKDVLSASTLANDGTERFRNGFVVDGFYGHNVGDVFNADYKVSMDIKKGQLRPMFYNDSVGMGFESALSSNVEKNGDLITLPISSHKVIIDQPYASTFENLNPYLVFKYIGDLTLDPESDDWMDVEERPAVVIDQTGIYDAIKYLADETGVTGTHWNSWETNWSSTSSSTTSAWWSTTTTTTTTTSQTQTGQVVTVEPDSVQSSVNDIVVDINIVPFIRSRRVYFYAGRMKPNTKLYLFIDDTDISSYARSTTSTQTFAQWEVESDVEIYKGSTTHPEGSNDLVTNSEGEIWGSFVIPSNDAVKFRTGARVVRLIDSSTNNLNEATSSAERIYNANGLSKTVQDLVISTKVPTFETQEISQDRVLISRSVSTVETWSGPDNIEASGDDDPLAQTFVVQDNGGAFITKLGAYFKTKSDSEPVLCQIRTVENGYPTKNIIASKTIKSADVSVSTDASVETVFEFDYPVYLKQGVEYSFVLKSNSKDYTTWVSELGQFDVTNPNIRIAEQPAAGVMFKSANASTWTADQFRDIKFKIYRAVFNTSVVGTAVFSNNDIPKKTLVRDPFLTYNGSNVIRVLHKNHGMADGGEVTISGAYEVSNLINNIPVSEINGTHAIGNVEFDSYTITVTTSANADGSGGGNAVKVTEDKRADLIKANIAEIVLPGTSLNYEYKASTAKSLGSTETAYVMNRDYNPILSGSNVILDYPITVPGQQNVNNITGTYKELVNKGLFVRSSFASTFDNLSPVIDVQRNSLICVSNRIDNAVAPADYSAGVNNAIANDPNGGVRFVPETDAKDNSGSCRYITRKVVLEQAAEDLKIWIKVNRPSNTYIDVYYRLDEDDTQILDDQDWVLATPVKEAPQTDDTSVFTEVEYDMEQIGVFNGFQVKIVLRSNNTTKTPVVKDYRAIALS